MSNFVCAICGGTIKMQSNQTAVCQKCGMEYGIEAIKEMAGNTTENGRQDNSDSTESNAEANFKSSSNSNDNAIDREALLIYLNDIRTLESVINKSKEKVPQLETKSSEIFNKLNRLKREYEEVQYNSPTKPIEENKKPLLNIGSIILLVLAAIFILGVLTLKADYHLAFLPVIFLLLPYPLYIFISRIVDNNSAKYLFQRDMKEYSHKKSVYDEKMENYPIIISKESKLADNRKQEIDNVLSEVNSEITSLQETLDKAYSTNIIPLPFRNLGGIYYLYDYLSTSKQSLGEALIQANLEAIKNNQMTILKYQAAMVIQQAQTNAKLDEVKDYYEMILTKAEETAYNTNLAASYAEMAATNTKVMKDMMTEQLAYQKADFYLNDNYLL